MSNLIFATGVFASAAKQSRCSSKAFAKTTRLLRSARKDIAIVLLLVTALPFFAAADSVPAPTNKLLRMYQFYYLPFSIEFKEGRTPNDVLPFHLASSTLGERLLRAEELQSLDAQWNRIRDDWRRKSLLHSVAVPVGESVRISQRLASHHVALTRNAFDAMSINDRISVGEVLKSKSPEVQAAFRQIRFLKSFTGTLDEGKFNFFIFSPSWCESSREYRVLFEAYFKQFPSPDVHLHSVVIEDPKEKIFDSKILKELFPFSKHYSHESTPRFLAMETVNGQAVVYEEGDALAQLYERFYKARRGFLDGKTTLFKKTGDVPGSKVDREVSSGPK